MGAGDLNGNLKHFNESMDAIYGQPNGLDDYLRKSQAMAYDGERAMFEAYGRNKYRGDHRLWRGVGRHRRVPKSKRKSP
jgi:hypothetical protein